MSRMLLVMLLVGLIITYLSLVRPCLRYLNERQKAQSGTIVIYFGAIGLGFMFLEVSLMQFFGIYLGHPTYGITVVLSSLLLSTGLGSFVSG